MQPVGHRPIGLPDDYECVRSISSAILARLLSVGCFRPKPTLASALSTQASDLHVRPAAVFAVGVNHGARRAFRGSRARVGARPSTNMQTKQQNYQHHQGAYFSAYRTYCSSCVCARSGSYSRCNGNGGTRTNIRAPPHRGPTTNE